MPKAAVINRERGIMDKKRPLNTTKDMTTLYETLGMTPTTQGGESNPYLTKGFHYLKIQRNLYRYQQGKDYQQLAEKSFLLAAEQGNVEGMCYYGLCCLEKCQEEKEKEGLSWLLKAAEEHSESMYQLGEYYVKKREYSTGFFWHEKAAEKDHPEALFQVGYLMLLCTNLPFNLEKIEYSMRRSREKGGLEVLFYALQVYKKEGNAKKQESIQQELLAKLFKQLEEYPARTFYQLGLGYLNGTFFTNPQEEKSTEELGIHYLKEAAGLNYHQAQYELSVFYFKGVFSPSEQSVGIVPEKGRKWLSLAMKNKNPDSFALFGKLCQKGLLEVKSEEEIKELYEISKKLGSMKGYVLSLTKEEVKKRKESTAYLFPEERVVPFWHDIQTMMETMEEKVAFWEDVLVRIPYLPSLPRKKAQQALYCLLSQGYSQLGNTKKVEEYISQEALNESVVYSSAIFSFWGVLDFEEYSLFYEKGNYYEKMGDTLAAIECYEQAREHLILADSQPLYQLYLTTRNVEKILIHWKYFKNHLSVEVCDILLPVLAENPEQIHEKATYGEIFKDFEDEMLGKIDLFSPYFTKQIQFTPVSERRELIFSYMESWRNTKESYSFFCQALEELIALNNCQKSMLFLAINYHPSLTYSQLGVQISKFSKNHEKSIQYFNLLLKEGVPSDLDENDLSKNNENLQKYAALCCLEQENPDHCYPLTTLWSQKMVSLDFNPWFKAGYYGLSTLYKKEEYGCQDPEEEESLLYLGIEAEELLCVRRLVELKLAELDFEEVKRLLTLSIQWGDYENMSELATIYMGEKEYEEAYDLYLELCEHLEEVGEPQWKIWKIQDKLVDLVVKVRTDHQVESLWCGDEEVESMFEILHQMALHDEDSGFYSRKISRFYRNGVCCEADFNKSELYLNHCLSRVPLSSDSKELSQVQKKLYHDLGVLYHKDENPNRNTAKAKVYFQLADIEYAHYFLSEIFQDEHNEKKAFFHGEKNLKNLKYSTSSQDNYFFIESAILVGECYEHGKGTLQNLNEAKKIYQEAQKKGSEEATNRLKRWE